MSDNGLSQKLSWTGMNFLHLWGRNPSRPT
jgi:hypothetical protein